MPKPEILLHRVDMYNKILSPEYKNNWSANYSIEKEELTKEILWNKRKEKIERITQKIDKALKKTQQVTPTFIDQLIGLYERKSTPQKDTYNVKVYIDSKDPTMPMVTSAETALNIKERIKQCDKFILLATNGAIESKWCNWELGYGDAQKYKKHIALFSMKPEGSSDSAYKGSEYMSIYPYIAYFDGSEKYTNGNPIQKGYYVRTRKESGSGFYITTLKDWLNTK